MQLLTGFIIGIVLGLIYPSVDTSKIRQLMTTSTDASIPLLVGIREQPKQLRDVEITTTSPLAAPSEQEPDLISPTIKARGENKSSVENGTQTRLSEKQATTGFQTAFQTAWKPFRSQTSATGFADSLSRRLPYEFVVLKTAPGNYEVGFHFNNPVQQKTVLDAVAGITGYRARAIECCGRHCY